MSNVLAPEITLEVRTLRQQTPEVMVAADDALQYAQALIRETFPTFPDSVQMKIWFVELGIFDHQLPPAKAAVRISFATSGIYSSFGESRTKIMENLLDADDRRSLVREAWRNTLVNRSKRISEFIRHLDSEGYEDVPHG